MTTLATPPVGSPLLDRPLRRAGAGVDDALATLASRRRRLAVVAALARAALLALALAGTLIALDLAYHFRTAPRLALLLASTALVAIVLVRALARARRTPSRAALALQLEARFPALRGLAVAAAGLDEAPGELPGAAEGTLATVSPEAALLRHALREEAERALARTDPAAAAATAPTLRVVRLLGLAGLAVLVAGVAMPASLGHAAARALTPWRTLPPTAAELAAQARAQALAAQARALAAASAAAAVAARTPIQITVTPGAAQVVRGQSLAVEARLTKAGADPEVRVRLGDGRWRTLPMDSTPDDPLRLSAVISDIDADCAYAVSVGGSRSDLYPITVYDLTQATGLQATIRAPAYARQPVRTTTGLDLEALQGSEATVHLVASGELGRVACVLDDGTAVPVHVQGATAECTLTLAHDGGYRLTAEDRHHHALQGLPEHASIRALVDQPPTIALLYPSIDTSVHPLEVVPVAAQVSDDVGLKEVRMVWRYGLEDPVTERRSCELHGVALRDMAAQFSLDIKHHPAVHQGDCIIFHLEVEDLKGQQATTDPFLITVRGYELMASYISGNNGGHNGQNGAAYVTILGALHDLAARRDQLTPAQYQAEVAHLADLYTFLPIAH